MSEPSHDDRFADLARRLLEGEAIDWAKEDVAESEVREGMMLLEKIVGGAAEGTQTRHAPDVQLASPPAPDPAPRPGEDRVIGGFRIVRKLGEGGMGVVYEAEQQHPRRLVALKVIRGGALVSPDTLKLFRREIQTLARLSHSGIAQLHETGVTDGGMHFFAMELVRGETLSDWLRSRPKGPTTPAEIKLRLGVFRKICDAVAYAHQKGVIHRDLKPGNILIPKPVEGASIQNAVPDVKILDFGLARITDSDVQATTFVTEMGRVQGTLPYMSPEQVRGNPDEIDLRTDVYALGVILYEMVAGRLPYDISKAQLHEAVRIICLEPPRSLSSTSSGTRRLDADVATIALKCLEKEAARRYQSAAALGEDVQRYLTQQPILARPPSAAYQFRKLVLRHKGPFAVAAAAFVLLAVFAGAMTVQAVRIGKERDRANQEAEAATRVSDFLEGLFNSSDPYGAPRKEVSPRELLDAGADRIDQELESQPKVQARLMRTIGIAYQGLGSNNAGEMLDKSRPLLNRWAELTESIYGQESLEYADVLSWRAGVDNTTRAHEIRCRLLKPDDPRLARSLYGVGCAQYLVRLPEAEQTLRRALEMVKISARRDEQTEIWILNDLGLALQSKKDYRGALQFMRKSVQIREQFYREGHPDRLLGYNNLGYALLQAGELEEARRYLQIALVATARKFGSDGTGLVLQSLGELERQEGRLDLARRSLERSLALFDKAKIDPWSSLFVDTLTSLGLVDEYQGRLAEAIDHLRRAHEIYAREPGVGTRDSAPDYARVLRKAGRIAEAERIEASSVAASTK